MSFIHTLLTPKRIIDRYIDALGMYRVVTLSLTSLAVVAIILSSVGLVPYLWYELLLSLAIACGVALGANIILGKLFRVVPNNESALITALIIFFLVLPAEWARLELSFIVATAAFFAVLSKYVIAYRKQHLLNPAAAGVLGVALLYMVWPLPPGYFETTWWIGQPILFIPLLLTTYMVVSKVRKWTPVLAFLSVAFIVFLFEEWRFTGELLTGWERFWLSGPSLFLATFMLTEPFTMPATKVRQGWYGALVGFLSQTTLFLPVLKMTPELALVLANALLYPWSLRQKLYLELIEKRLVADSTYEFVFKKPKNFTFTAGQYLEWMLPHESDSRGPRRYFTIASSPSESVVRLALKVMEKGSSYKQALMQLTPGSTVIASQLAGDFVLPKRPGQKLGFIAGGIGVTPFVSHVRYMRDTQTHFDTAFLYCANTTAELAYADEFKAAGAIMPLTFIPVIAKEAVESPLEQGFVTVEMLERRVSDFKERHWYLSGPPGMVNAYDALLKKAGVKKITKDFFPGLA